MPWEKQFDREEALSRAMAAFWARGYEATSMQDLVEVTGVNRASLYGTFGDKHALFLEALRLYDDKMRRTLLAELEAGGQPREAIRKLFQVFIKPVSEGDDNRGCFLVNTALELSAHDPEAARIVARAQEQIEAFFLRMIKLGKANGEFPSHIKPSVAARSILASLVGMVVLTRSRPDPTLLQTIADEALRRLT